MPGEPLLTMSLPINEVYELEAGYRDMPRKLDQAINRVVNRALSVMARKAREQIPQVAFITDARLGKRVVRHVARGDYGNGGSVQVNDGPMGIDAAVSSQMGTSASQEVVRGKTQTWDKSVLRHIAGKYGTAVNLIFRGKEVMRGTPLREGMQGHYSELMAAGQAAIAEKMPKELEKMAQEMVKHG